MNHAVYSAVSGSLSALDRLDALTNNLANASTPGFKAQLLVQQSAHGKAGQAAGRVATPFNRAQLQTDFSQGPIERDGSTYHLALAGKGFFVIDAGASGQLLTRRGSFNLDQQGFLVNGEGRRVQGDGGDIQLGDAAQNGPIEIGNDGTVQQGLNRLGKVRVVDVPDPSQLERAAGSAFSPGGQTISDAADGTYAVMQGALEGTNASPVTNLVALIETMRGFEAYMTATQRLDTVNEKVISDVARV
ncbi:MAG: flagellar hook basal-body protein [Deltaproteobacteria bacterium]|nr:flagellar hook basal-body protein [Deltaproteobacteria bacterium]